MNILFFLEDFKLGGVEKSLLDLINKLIHHNVNVSVCTWGEDDEMLKDNPLPDSVHILKAPSIFKSISLKNRRLNRVKRFINAILLHLYLHFKSFDRVVNFHYAANWRCSLIKFNCKEQIAVYHDANVYNECFSKKLAGNIHKFLFVSESVKNEVEAKFPYIKDKSALFYNSVNKEFILHQSAASPFEKTRLTLVTCGRLEEEKGYDIAVKAASILKKYVDFEWHFIGDGKDRDGLMKLAEDCGVAENIVFDGFQSNPYSYMNMADIYVQPSRFESYGITITEALVLRKPIICTNVSNPYIEDNKTVLLCQLDENDVASKIKYLSENNEVRMNLVNNVTKINFDCFENENIRNFAGII